MTVPHMCTVYLEQVHPSLSSFPPFLLPLFVRWVSHCLCVAYFSTVETCLSFHLATILFSLCIHFYLSNVYCQQVFFETKTQAVSEVSLSPWALFSSRIPLARTTLCPSPQLYPSWDDLLSSTLSRGHAGKLPDCPGALLSDSSPPGLMAFRALASSVRQFQNILSP
jgi:hypothetical protein